MRVRIPAKINLNLRVGRPGADGFHPLYSWMCTIGLYDEMSLEPAANGVITLSCDRPELSCDDTNLVVRAAKLLAAEAGRGGAVMHLTKRIPMGAGLGGGSADAAFALLALNLLWKLDWPASRLAELAMRLGSDLAFFIHAASALCRGRGERMRPLPPPRPRAALIVSPQQGLSTAAVYRRFDEMSLGSNLDKQPDPAGWADLDAESLLPQLVNDLEAPAFDLMPELGKLRQRLERRLGRIVRMSGSGSSLFTLYDDWNAANDAAAALADEAGVRAAAAEMAVPARIFSQGLAATSDR